MRVFSPMEVKTAADGSIIPLSVNLHYVFCVLPLDAFLPFYAYNYTFAVSLPPSFFVSTFPHLFHLSFTPSIAAFASSMFLSLSLSLSSSLCSSLYMYLSCLHSCACLCLCVSCCLCVHVTIVVPVYMSVSVSLSSTTSLSR